VAPPNPPSNVLPYLQEAATGTGLPLSVVEAQNYAESGYGSNEGPSSAGAEGPWQFEPSTFASLGYTSGITDWSTSTQAYVKYMNQLLKQEGGNIFKALEAYNAGPGNLSAGASYASGIESSAGVSQSATAGSAVSTDASSFSIPLPIPGFPSISSSSLGTIGNSLTSGILSSLGIPNLKDLAQRLGVIILGFAILIVGISIISKGSSQKATPITINNEEAAPQAREVRSPVSRPRSARAAGGGAGAAAKTGGEDALKAVALG
jgi:transglycosylase-like protein with SLT domain